MPVMAAAKKRAKKVSDPNAKTKMPAGWLSFQSDADQENKDAGAKATWNAMSAGEQRGLLSRLGRCKYTKRRTELWEGEEKTKSEWGRLSLEGREAKIKEWDTAKGGSASNGSGGSGSAAATTIPATTIPTGIARGGASAPKVKGRPQGCPIRWSDGGGVRHGSGSGSSRRADATYVPRRRQAASAVQHRSSVKGRTHAFRRDHDPRGSIAAAK